VTLWQVEEAERLDGRPVLDALDEVTRARLEREAAELLRAWGEPPAPRSKTADPVERRIYRQGDVLLFQLDEFPSDVGAASASRGRLVLAHGEATGHAHVIDDGRASLYLVKRSRRTSVPLAMSFRTPTFPWDGEELILVVDEGGPVALAHDEHDSLAVDPGVYRVVRQRQLDLTSLVVPVYD
jgi:hypothetical protein